MTSIALRPLYRRGTLLLVAAGLLLVLTGTVNADKPAVATDSQLFSFVLPWDDASPGITSLSALLPKPAGKFGPVHSGPDGHLYVGTQRIRLFGVDQTFSADFPTHEQAEKVAGRLAKFGINIMRFHIMDSRRFPDGILLHDGKNTRDFDPAALERLDYYTDQLEKHGVYVYLCLLNYRPFNAADGLPKEIEELGSPYQGRAVVGFFDPTELDLQKEYARKLLTHRNAYTGRTYAEDPGVAFVEINNENGLVHAWLKGMVDQLPAIFQHELEGQWNSGLRQRYGTTEKLRAVWDRGAQPLGAEVTDNADFAHGLDGWTLEQHLPAVATAEVNQDAPADLPGAKSVCVNVTAAGPLSWSVRFEQTGRKIKADQGYTLTFWAKAEHPCTLSTSLEMSHDPWHTLAHMGKVDLTTAWQHYRLTTQANDSDDSTRLIFDPPQQTGRIWLAGISLKPGGVEGLPAGQSLEAGTVAWLPFAHRGERSLDVERDWVQFLWEKEQTYWQTLYHYLKDDLQVKSMVIGTVVGYSTPNLMAEIGCIDTHAYWQHPRFPGRPWDPNNWFINNISMVNAQGGVLPGLALKRVYGLPFCITEYGHPAPNTFTAEAHLLRAAYGSLQDWDYTSASRYAQRNDFDLRRIRGYFDIDQHPVAMVTMVPAAAMWLRDDVEPARQAVAAKLDVKQELAMLPRSDSWDLGDLGAAGISPEEALIHRVGLVTQGRGVPPGALTPDQARPKGDDWVSDTGQLNWNDNDPKHGVVTVNTARSKAVIGYGGGKRFDLGTVTVEPGPTMQDGWSAITLTAMSGDLAKAPASVLVTASGYCQNTNMGWKNPEKSTVGRDWGEAPTLVEGIPARITLPFSANSVKAWALDERGQRKAPVPIASGPNGRAVLVIGPQWRTLWYEIAAQ